MSEDERFMNILDKLFTKLEEEEMCFVAIVARQLRLRRNIVVFVEGFIPPSILIHRAHDQMEVHEKAQLMNREGQPQYVSAERKICEKPREGFVKLNWDATLDSKRRVMGVGILARDCRGGVVAAKCIQRPRISDPVVAEAYSAWETVELSVQLGLSQANIESDSLEVVKALCSASKCWSNYGHLIDDAKSLVQSF